MSTLTLSMNTTKRKLKMISDGTLMMNMLLALWIGLKSASAMLRLLFFSCLGFHPYKEIALFRDDHSEAAMAYELNSSKVRYLGIMEHEYSELDIHFAYTPCWTMDLPGSN
jgi:hypothetical protein